MRPHATDMGYSGDWAIKAGEDLITKGLRGNYPINTDEVHLLISESLIEQKLPSKIENIQELLGSVEPLVKNLENKINVCKAKA